MPTADDRVKDGHKPLMVWNVPEELKKKFKMKCAELGKTMEEAIVDLIKKWVK